MKTVKLTQEAWEKLMLWKFEHKSKNLSQAIIDQDNVHIAALNYIGVLTNDQSKK